MAKAPVKKPQPRKVTETVNSATFQSRVDYVAKALQRGSWGRKFDACFEHHDSNQLVATIMLRAERNPKLKKSIKSVFRITKWALIPWHEVAKPYAGMSARQIGVLAEEARFKGEADFKALCEANETTVEKP